MGRRLPQHKGPGFVKGCLFTLVLFFGPPLVLLVLLFMLSGSTPVLPFLYTIF